MIIQRYRSHSSCRNIPELGGMQHGSRMDKDDDGPMVRYKDHAAALSTQEARIKELETALNRMLVIYDCEEFAPRKGIEHGISVGADVCNQARKALEPK